MTNVVLITEINGSLIYIHMGTTNAQIDITRVLFATGVFDIEMRLQV